MVKFGTFAFPNVQTWLRVKPRIASEKAVSTRKIASRQELGSTGFAIEVIGVITGTQAEVKSKIEEMENLCGSEDIFDLEVETPKFKGLMLEPEFERSLGFANFVPYRVRVVQTNWEYLRLDYGRLGLEKLK